MTKCLIGIKNSNGTVDSIYCHQHGDLLGVGAILFSNYKSVSKTIKLLLSGDINKLGDNPEDCDRTGQYGNVFKFSSFSKFASADPYGYGHSGTQYGYVQDAKTQVWTVVDFSNKKVSSVKELIEMEMASYAK